MEVYKVLIVIYILFFVFNPIVSCPTSLGKNLLDTNQVSYRDLSKQANLNE